MGRLSIGINTARRHARTLEAMRTQTPFIVIGDAHTLASDIWHLTSTFH
jgi:hypothetical protein